jgi:hypothetical protein
VQTPPRVQAVHTRECQPIQTRHPRGSQQAAGAASRERRRGGEGEPPHAPADVPAEQRRLQSWPVLAMEAVAPSRPQTGATAAVAAVAAVATAGRPAAGSSRRCRRGSAAAALLSGVPARYSGSG